MGYLTPLEAKELRELKIIAFDTEDDSNGNVKLLNFASRMPNGKIKHTTFRHPVFARNWIRQHKGRCFFVAHNLEYDICNVYRDQGFTDVSRLSYTSRLIVAEMNDANAKWIDSFNFFPSSLKKMGEVVGLEKMETDDFDNLEYCRRDTEIVLVFMEQFQKKLIDEVGVGLSPTIGGISMKAFRTNFLEGSIETWNEPKALEAYFGGRCELFYKGKIDGYGEWQGINVADVNSMYPRVMQERYPDCSSLNESEDWEQYEFGISEVTIFVPESVNVPPLPCRNEAGRLVFPVGTFRGTWTNHEIRHAVKTCRARVLQTHYSIGTDTGLDIFSKYVAHFYEKRKQSKNEFEKTFYKLFLNNLYGRLAQHNPRVEARTAEMDEEEQEETQARLVKRLGHFWIYEIPLVEPPETANWLWGTYVTSYARILLHSGLLAVEKAGGQLIYCDTDSIFWAGPEAPAGLDLDEKKLGAWKVERFKSGEFIIPKGYILRGYPEPVTEKTLKKHPKLKIGDSYSEIKIACKGVPMPRAMSIDEIETESNPAWRFLKMGEATSRRPHRLRAALARDLVPGAWGDYSKSRKTPYTRRPGPEWGPTRPPVMGR